MRGLGEERLPLSAGVFEVEQSGDGGAAIFNPKNQKGSYHWAKDDPVARLL